MADQHHAVYEYRVVDTESIGAPPLDASDPDNKAWLIYTRRTGGSDWVRLTPEPDGGMPRMLFIDDIARHIAMRPEQA